LEFLINNKQEIVVTTKDCKLIKYSYAYILLPIFILALSSFALAQTLSEDNSENIFSAQQRIELDDVLLNAQPDDEIPVIVRFKSKLKDADYNQLEQKIGKYKTKKRFNIINGMAGELTKKQIEALKKNSNLDHIEYDTPVYAFLNTATPCFGTDDVNTDFGLTGSGIAIAILDTGIDVGHVDLDGGKVIGWKDYVNNITTPYDDHGHGTHVSSIAAGAGDGNSIYKGVASGASLVGVKVLDKNGSGSSSSVISAIDWCLTNKNAFSSPIKVINLSLGTSGSSDGKDSQSVACNNAMDAGIVVVVAAGNGGPVKSTIGSPGAAEKVITVANMSDLGEKGFYLAYSSSRGPTADNRIKPDISAPGTRIAAADQGTTSGYVMMTGTSMATPFVAGVCALILQNNSALTPGQVKSQIMNTAQDWATPGQDIEYGAGRLDAYKAISGTTSKPTVPSHYYLSDSLSGTGNSDDWYINVTNTSYPIAVTLIITDSGDNFNIELYNPGGTSVATSNGTTRQETIGYVPASTGVYKLQVKSSSGGGPYFFDLSAGVQPVSVSDLTAGNPKKTTVKLTWTAPLEAISGTSSYDIRYSTANITDVNWDSATQCTGEPTPGTVGTSQNFVVTGLIPNTTYYFALKTGDNASNTSGLSNVPSQKTTTTTANDQSVTTNEDTAINITLTATDTDGDTITYSVVTPPTNGTLSGTPPNLTYTPKPIYTGPGNVLDSFTFKASAGGFDSNVATVSITVTPVARSITINLLYGWNLISCPGVPVVSDIAILTAGNTNIPAHAALVWDPATQKKVVTTTLEFGKCYFFVATASTQLTIQYYSRNSISLPLKYGWNGIGSLSISVPTNTLTSDPPGKIPASVLRWDTATQKKVVENTIEPGVGYLIPATADCTLAMNCPSAAPKQILPTKPSWEGIVSVHTQKGHEELIFGMNRSASDGFDVLYDVAIPPFFESVDSINAGWLSDDPVFGFLNESYVRGASTASWELSVTLTESGELSWRNLPKSYRFELLYDNQTLNMNIVKSLQLPVGEHRLKIFMSDIPKKTNLLVNYPNPFNPETWIPFELSLDTKVEIMIYNSTGQLVRKLDLGHKQAGRYINRAESAYWDGKNEAGEVVSSGIYFYSLVTPDFTQTKKLVIIR
jgi:serine protease AprX